MPLPVFPAIPKPSRLEGYGEEWPAIVAEFDGVYSQVRQLTNRGLRRFILGYDMHNPMGRDNLQLFFNLRKGKSERFDITIPWLLMDDAGFEKGTAAEWTPDTDTAISTVSPRSGARHGRITVPDPVLERRIRGVQKIPLYPGDTMTVSGFAKANNAAGGIGSIFVEFFTDADAFVAGGPIAGDVAFTTAYVQYISGAVVVPGTVTYGKVSVRNTTGATIGRVLDFDDLLVELTLPCRFDAIRLEWRFKPPAFWSVDIPFLEAP